MRIRVNFIVYSLIDIDLTFTKSFSLCIKWYLQKLDALMRLLKPRLKGLYKHEQTYFSHAKTSDQQEFIK